MDKTTTKSIIVSETDNIFKDLSIEQLCLLCFVAYAGPSISINKLYDYFTWVSITYRTKNINKATKDKIAKSLIDSGYILYNRYSYNAQYSLRSRYLIPLLSTLLLKHKDWLDRFNRCVPYVDSKIGYLLSALSEKLNGVEYKGKKSSYFYFSPADMIIFSCFIYFKEFRCIINIIPLEYSFYFIMWSIQIMQISDRTDFLPTIKRYAEISKLDSEDKAIVDECIAYASYLADGEYTTIDKPKSYFGHLLRGIHLANNQEYELAAEEINKGLKSYNKTVDDYSGGPKGVYYQLFACYYQAICFSRCKNKANKLEQINTKLSKLSYHYTMPGMLLAFYYATGHEPQTYQFERAYSSCEIFDCKNVYWLIYLVQQYLGVNVSKDYGINNLSLPNHKILRHEMRNILKLQENELTELNELYGSQPVLHAVRRLEPWEYTLQKVLDETTNKEDNTEKDRRVVYVIKSSRYIEIREQTKLKSGAWGVGKSISTTKLADLEDILDEYDKKLVNSTLNSYSYLGTDVEDVLPIIVGSDKIYADNGKGLVHVVVDEEKPYIILDKNKKGFFFTSNLSPSDFCHTCDRVKVLKKTPTHYSVIRYNDRQRAAFELLLNLKNIPLSGEAVLRDFMQKVNTKLGVHSTAIEGSEDIKSIDGDPQVVIRVSTGRSLRFMLDLTMQAHKDGKEVVTAGRGSAIIMDEISGERCHLKRKLSREKDIFNNIKQYLEDATASTLSNNFVELSAQQMLDLMDYVRESSEYVIEWPKGDQLKLCVAQEKEMTLRMKKAGQWFEVEGNVTVDMNVVLNLAELLEAIANSTGKYVRINENEYMLISENLKRQLERLNAMAVNERGKIKLSPFQAAVGDDIFGENGIVKADESWQKLRNKIVDSYNKRPRVPSSLQAELRDYQFEGYQWMKRLTEWGGGACLADDMGLGKTVQAIAFMLSEQKNGAALVVAPASVLPNWRNELERFAPSLNVKIVNTAVDRAQLINEANKGDVLLTTYGILISESELLIDKKWNIVCLDEAHAIKNRDTKMSKVAMQLQANKRIAMTGTPIQNHLGELWNLFQFLNPGLLGSHDQFNKKFITEIEQKGDHSVQRQLKRIIAPFMLRRTKKEVADELPDKTDIKLSVDLTDEETAIYESLRARAEQELKEGNRVDVNVLSQITQLRRAACTPKLVNSDFKGESSKLTAFISLVEEICSGGNKVLVFSQFTSFLQIAKEYLDKAKIEYLYFDGSTTIAKREKIIEQFRNDDCQLFLISLKAGGLGLNLTEANYVIHLDPWWNPAIEQQATDRAYRIGQQQKVTVYHLIASHTIEEKILRLHGTKRDLADQLLEGTNVSHKLTAKDLLEMLEK